MKKYRLKEAAKPYIHSKFQNEVRDMNWWTESDKYAIDITKALEEVESKTRLNISPSKWMLCRRSKGKPINWTEQERELVEFCINEFQDIDDLKQALN